jgi:hypothetical protein
MTTTKTQLKQLLIRRKTVIGMALLVWLTSCWIASHSGLALVVDLETGAKGCVDGLSRYFGFNESNAILSIVSTACVLLALAIPPALMVYLLADLCWSHRRQV